MVVAPCTGCGRTNLWRSFQAGSRAQTIAFGARGDTEARPTTGSEAERQGTRFNGHDTAEPAIRDCSPCCYSLRGPGAINYLSLYVDPRAATALRHDTGNTGLSP